MFDSILRFIARKVKLPLVIHFKLKAGGGDADIYSIITDEDGQPLSPKSLVFFGNTHYASAFTLADQSIGAEDFTAKSHEVIAINKERAAVAITAVGGPVGGILDVYCGRHRLYSEEVVLKKGATLEVMQAREPYVPTMVKIKHDSIEDFLESYGYAFAR